MLTFNSLSYLYYRPKHGFLRHLATNTLRMLQSLLTLGCVTRRDPEEWKIPKLAKHHRHLAEIGEVRTIPPTSADIPLLPNVQVVVDRGVVKPEPRPGFMIAPKSTPKEKIWSRAKPGEKAIFYIIGGGYQMGQPVQWFVTWELATRLGLRIFRPMLDYLAAWDYMVTELGFEPQLDEQGFKRLGLPGAVFASAPWCDVTGSFPSISRNAHKPSFSRHYSYPAQRDPLMSPAFALKSDRHFARLSEKGVKMHVDYGEDEKLHDEVEATVGIMRNQGLEVDALEYVFARTPIKFWPGIGFSWPIVAEATERLVRQTWPKHVIPGEGVIRALQEEKEIKEGKGKK
ncbi:hypothetical protein A1Q2_02438 [Trichosporon asahii var. asahii CBS 8904]|uniref:Uncharacterized protein n=1 Tax=Trichosporon asahii var. asahii (strain CBS 8904) TaxID=1220162 RepID=K1W357_TRIAC|nr:hypothetical protein A1Q2_02438 [Trichosporon asahii var. asahii CBS 8904]